MVMRGKGEVTMGTHRGMGGPGVKLQDLAFLTRTWLFPGVLKETH